MQDVSRKDPDLLRGSVPCISEEVCALNVLSSRSFSDKISGMED